MSEDNGVVTLFRAAVVACAVVAGAGLLAPEILNSTASALMSGVLRSLDWFFMGASTGFLLLCLWLALSPHGEIKLGQPDDEPEFSTISWLAMLFSAGMGAGLLFWGVAEPMTHFSDPPIGAPSTTDAARQAMILTNFHWGLHAWAIYGVAAMALAYFGFRHETPNLPGAPIRATFVGKWVEPVAKGADFIAIVAVVFGVAGSLGMGIMQVHTGLHIATGIPEQSMLVQTAILVTLVICYMLSAATSLDEGIKWLSNLNMTLVVVLLLFLLLVGSTPFLLRTYVTSVGDYASSIVGLSFQMYPFVEVQEWLHNWTLTYFIWWIAWAPFVGVFIARISRGRTIREFVLGVLLAPTAFSILWFAIFGGSAFHLEMEGSGGVTRLVQEDMTQALFHVYDSMPLSMVLSLVTVFLVFVFLVTSADSATFVLSMMTSDGSMDPPRKRKLTWGIVLAGMGAALLFTKNIQMMRAVVISGAFPFTLILLLQLGAFVRKLHDDNHQERNDGDEGGARE